MSKNHLNLLFLVSVKAEDNRNFQFYACVKFFKRNLLIAYKQIRALHLVIRDFFFIPEPKLMQAFPLSFTKSESIKRFI